MISRIREFFAGSAAGSESLGDWQAHVNAKFLQYEKAWNAAHERWLTAHSKGDRAGMTSALEEQGLYLRAEQVAHRDMNIPREQWDGRRYVDYIEEARQALSKSSEPLERLRAVERIMAQTPR